MTTPPNIPWSEVKAKMLSDPEVRAEYDRLDKAHPQVAFPYSEWTRVEDGLPEPEGDGYYVQHESGAVDEGYWLRLDEDEGSADYGWFTPEEARVVAWAPQHLPEGPEWG